MSSIQDDKYVQVIRDFTKAIYASDLKDSLPPKKEFYLFREKYLKREEEYKEKKEMEDSKVEEPKTPKDKNIKYPYKVDSKVWKNEHDKYEKYINDIKYSNPIMEWDQYTTIQYKICSKCSQNKLLSNYATNTSGRDPFTKDGYRNRRPECKYCTKKGGESSKIAKKKSKKAGKPIKAPEGTSCEICDKKDKIVYDHDHNTCEFRGWLCDPCNRGLGQCGDNIDGLVKRLNYLLTKTNKENIPIITQNHENGFLDVS